MAALSGRWRASVTRLALLDQLNLIALRRVNKGNPTTIRVEVWAVGILQAQPRKVPSELLQAFFQQLLLAPKSPERSNCAHMGRAGGLHVNPRIPHVEAFSR